MPPWQGNLPEKVIREIDLSCYNGFCSPVIFFYADIKGANYLSFRFFSIRWEPKAGYTRFEDLSVIRCLQSEIWGLLEIFVHEQPGIQ